MWEGEKRIAQKNYRGKRIYFYTSPNILSSSDPIISGWGLGWGCNIYGSCFGDYLLCDSMDFNNPEVVEELKTVLMDQAKMSIDRILFDLRREDKMFFAYRLKDAVEAKLIANKKMSWSEALEDAITEDLMENSPEKRFSCKILDKLFKISDKKDETK